MLPINTLELRIYGAGRVVAAINASYFCRCVILVGVDTSWVEVDGPPLAECCPLPTIRDRGGGGE